VFTNVDIPKRWRVHIERGSGMRHFIVANLLLLFEAEYLSPKKLLSWRFLTGTSGAFPGCWIMGRWRSERPPKARTHW
jgi:hypothetical protein